jgi:hypothetical protein
MALGYDAYLSTYSLMLSGGIPRLLDLGAYLVYMLGGFIAPKANRRRIGFLAGLGAGVVVATLGTLVASLLGVIVEYQPVGLILEPFLGGVFGLFGASIREITDVRPRKD